MKTHLSPFLHPPPFLPYCQLSFPLTLTPLHPSYLIYQHQGHTHLFNTFCFFPTAAYLSHTVTPSTHTPVNSPLLTSLLIGHPNREFTTIHHSLNAWANRSSCSKRELLSLIGTLSFAVKVVPAGRTFLRRMIDLSSSIISLDEVITLSETFMLDLRWLQEFATPWNG